MPTIAAESLTSELKKRKAGLCLLILGKDTYLRDAFRKQVIETSIDPATRDWALSRYSANEGEFGNALAQARTVPMLAQRQVVIVSEVEALEEMPEDKRDTETKDLGGIFGEPGPIYRVGSRSRASGSTDKVREDAFGTRSGSRGGASGRSPGAVASVRGAGHPDGTRAERLDG